MTVKELIEWLQTCPEDAKVMLWKPVYDKPFEPEFGDEVRYDTQENCVKLW